ncbi:HD domain-containing protein [Romboutsia lituseburensis]|uniref:HD domain-containing protein n=1 Tax=Romboutsia lituseburensis TaxID=1537 RepID=UPI00215AE9AB|nr:HD domain-containing protein [Romboutsia lituseburensis]MCR8746001.1 HD domain-containing protein [Romboutsia lituseburensis]
MKLQNILKNSLCSESTYDKLIELDKDSILKEIIPQIGDMKNVGECKYHVVNAYEHSLNALKELEQTINRDNFFSSHLFGEIEAYLNTILKEGITKFQLLKLGVFLHDIGKPESKTVDDTGRAHFKGHEIVGEEIVINLGKSLGFDDQTINLLAKYVRYHMILLVLYKKNDMSKDNLFDIFKTLGDDVIGVLLLGYCDIVSTRKLLNPNEDSGVIKSYMEYILTNYLYRYKML